MIERRGLTRAPGVEMSESKLESITYVSSAVRLLSLEEISRILERARKRNDEYGITGLLLYIDGNFMQYLEGPEESLDVIYEIIEADPHHSGLIQISREAIDSRQFRNWSMAFQTRDLEGYVGTPAETRAIDLILASAPGNPSSAQIVLRSFWERGGS